MTVMHTPGSVHPADARYMNACSEVASVAMKRTLAEPFTNKEREAFRKMLTEHFPETFEGLPRYHTERLDVPPRLSAALCEIIRDYALKSEWYGGYLESFWKDVISQPFLEDITAGYWQTRVSLWCKLAELALSHSHSLEAHLTF